MQPEVHYLGTCPLCLSCLADNGPATHNPGRPPVFDVRFYLLVLGQILATRAIHLRLLSPRRRRRRRHALRLNIGGDSDGSGRRLPSGKFLTELGAGRGSSDISGQLISHSRKRGVADDRRIAYTEGRNT